MIWYHNLNSARFVFSLPEISWFFFFLVVEIGKMYVCNLGLHQKWVCFLNKSVSWSHSDAAHWTQSLSNRHHEGVENFLPMLWTWKVSSAPAALALRVDLWLYKLLMSQLDAPCVSIHHPNKHFSSHTATPTVSWYGNDGRRFSVRKK